MTGPGSGTAGCPLLTKRLLKYAGVAYALMICGSVCSYIRTFSTTEETLEWAKDAENLL
ncbi:hypothetical protein [Mycobacteroides abscessus]|uniref:hypothetical protein n=1 Tax=Mycobacteroides abscessus TaxID=36809 RepID=UPI0013F5D243|nr:hypothetical protein [Mycobacteroides abscessus]